MKDVIFVVRVVKVVHDRRGVRERRTNRVPRSPGVGVRAGGRRGRGGEGRGGRREEEEEEEEKERERQLYLRHQHNLRHLL